MKTEKLKDFIIYIEGKEFKDNDAIVGFKIIKERYKNIDDILELNDSLYNSGIKEIIENLPELTFKDISTIENIEKRRIAFKYFGQDNIKNQIPKELISKETLKKEFIFLNPETFEPYTNVIDDVYTLYKINKKELGSSNDCYFIECSCPSTKREYIIWVDYDRVKQITNKKEPDAIDCIAWTFTTRLKKEDIDYIVRHGDCLLFKTNKDNFELLDFPRHLTKSEYLKLLKYET